jgi:hypothetical protein
MFTPIAKFASIYNMFAIVVALDLEVHQIDIKNIFLNGELNKTIFMEQLEGYNNEHKRLYANLEKPFMTLNKHIKCGMKR